MPQMGKRFQPHMQRSGMWGYKDGTVRKVLKERPNIICYILYHPFRALLMYRFSKPHIPLNPTFRYASCGAEIFCPFGASV
ncbi:hypothetical protein Barb6XT_01436 [Bacteroidales bacterium Barb6XT]|nr:hypothetical protein Barb6XT_01436 [Bacteroidales bacterium Barb6XT]